MSDAARFALAESGSAGTAVSTLSRIGIAMGSVDDILGLPSDMLAGIEQEQLPNCGRRVHNQANPRSNASLVNLRP